MAELITQTIERVGKVSQKQAYKVVFSVQTATNGSVTDTDTDDHITNIIKGMSLGKIRTLFGATAPTDDVDLQIKDADSVDILGGGGTNMIDSATNNEFWPLVDGQPTLQPIEGALTLSVANNSVNTALFTVELYIYDR